MRPQFQLDITDQVLEIYPPKLSSGGYTTEGRPTSAAVEGFTSGTSNLFASEAVTLDAYTDTVTAAEGATTLTVTDTTEAKVGRRYWVVDENGANGYEVHCIGIPSGTALEIANPLRMAVTAGSIAGHGLRRTMTETTAIYRQARVVWTLTYATGKRRITQWIDIVTYPLRLEDLGITESDLENRRPEFGESVDVEGQWRGLIQAAFEDIWDRIEGSRGDMQPDLLRSRDMLRSPIIYRALWHHFVRSVNDNDRETYAKLFEEALNLVLNSKTAWYDSDDDMVRSWYGTRYQQVGDETVVVYDGTSEGIAGSESIPASSMARVS